MNLPPYQMLLGLGGLVALIPLVILVDKLRIRRTLEEEGGIFIRAHWRPFHAADVGENWMRIYDVIYQDILGRMHVCQAQIAFLSPIRLERDHVA